MKLLSENQILISLVPRPATSPIMPFLHSYCKQAQADETNLDHMGTKLVPLLEQFSETVCILLCECYLG